MATRELTEVPADPGEWRPQVPLSTRRPLQVTDPIVEPLWSGWRVLVHFDASQPASTRLIDRFGDDVAATEPEVVAELGSAVLAVDAVIDAILTHQATRSGEGVAVLHQSNVTTTSVFLSRRAGVEVERPPMTESSPLALVCLDLLRLDGQDLLDLPLLERKRLLEGIVRGGERVRVSPFTRPPIEPWIASWKAAGFKGGMLKAANGRYVPGGQSRDWVPITRTGR